jgi:serine protease Do
MGFIGAVTTGTVHRVDRWVEAGIRLAPGNSGGPLADARGRVVGINSMVAGGLALAVPSDTVGRFVARQETTPMLGVTVRPLQTARGFGWLVLGIEPGSAAERASLLPGDVLLGGVDVDSGPVPIRFLRPGSDRVREVTAVIRP